jgi:ABC-type multidrug transport system fused ATPase/permease subunit
MRAVLRSAVSGLVPLRPLLLLLGDRRRLVLVLFAAALLSGAADAVILSSLAVGAAALVNGTSTAHFDFGPVHADERLGVLLLFALAVAFVRLGLQVVLTRIPARIATGVLGRQGSLVFDAFTRASWSEQSRDREGFLQELLTMQAAQVAMGALQITTGVVALTNFLVLVGSALTLNVLAALIVMVAAGALFVLMRPLTNLGARRAEAVSQASRDYSGGVSEAVRVAGETYVFGSDAAQRARLDRLLARLQAPYFHVQFLAALVGALYQSLIYLLVVVALLILYLTKAGPYAGLAAVMLLLIRAGSWGQQMQAAYQRGRQAIPSLERIEQARERYITSIPQRIGRRLPAIDSIAFAGVSFAYEPGRPVLTDVSFNVARGEVIGIVGPTGAGKSTLVQILLGLRDPSSGSYLVNGLPAGDFAREDWHRAVAYLPQEPQLLHASVADNIRFFRELDDAAVQQAAELAGIDGEIRMWSRGYGTIVGPRADAVSGGQQQRLCLARALACQPEVLVLDEPTSALDPHTEMLIQRSLGALKQSLTLFIVAHRMSTLDICDRIMVIVDGRLQALDSADALLTHSDYYRRASSLVSGLSTAKR